MDLLNPKAKKEIRDFINITDSLGLYPKITRPSRIKAQTATLIDNIYSNVLDTTTICAGLLIEDITDHLPVFVTYQCSVEQKNRKKQ